MGSTNRSERSAMILQVCVKLPPLHQPAQPPFPSCARQSSKSHPTHFLLPQKVFWSCSPLLCSPSWSPSSPSCRCYCSCWRLFPSPTRPSYPSSSSLWNCPHRSSSHCLEICELLVDLSCQRSPRSFDLHHCSGSPLLHCSGSCLSQLVFRGWGGKEGRN